MSEQYRDRWQARRKQDSWVMMAAFVAGMTAFLYTWETTTDPNTMILSSVSVTVVVGIWGYTFAYWTRRQA